MTRTANAPTVKNVYISDGNGYRADDVEFWIGSQRRILLFNNAATRKLHLLVHVFRWSIDRHFGSSQRPDVSVLQGTDLVMANQSWTDGPYHPAMDNQHSNGNGVAEAGEYVKVTLALSNIIRPL